MAHLCRKAVPSPRILKIGGVVKATNIQVAEYRGSFGLPFQHGTTEPCLGLKKGLFQRRGHGAGKHRNATRSP